MLCLKKIPSLTFSNFHLIAAFVVKMAFVRQCYEDFHFTLSIAFCKSSQTITDISVRSISRFDAFDRIIEYSEQEKNTLVVYNEDNIEFKGANNIRKRYEFPTNQVTMARLVEAIIDFETIVRPNRWCLDHIFYEGLYSTGDGAYSISWGS